MRRQEPARPAKRDGFWYLVRRVPKEYAELDRRGKVKITTGIAVADDPRGMRAKEVVSRLDGELQAYWEGLRDGQSAEAKIRFEAAQRRARQLDLPYRTAAELAEGPLSEILARWRHLADADKVEDDREVAAVLGGEERPQLLISDMAAEFERLQRDFLDPMSPDQVRKWRNQKSRAQENLQKVLGDKLLTELTRADAQQYRRWWQDRRTTEGLDIATANKEFGNVAKMFDTINEQHDLGLKPIFAKIRLAGAVEKQRVAFDPKFVQDRILAAGVLDGLNEQARDLVRLVAETGLRLSEACNLTKKTIHLKAPVPYVEVLPDDRKMKTEHSQRQMPLIGVALEAMKRHPDGFERYRDKAASLSALVNKYLDHKKLLGPGQTLYSLRHTFEDRLTAAETPDRVAAELMGHKYHRPRYGLGASLAQKRKWLQKIAYKVSAAPAASA